MTQYDATTAIEMARTLAQDLATRADAADKQGKLPAEDIAALRETGYLALNVPREFGGSGLSMRDCVAAQLELAQGNASTALVAGMQLQVFGQAIETGSWPDSVHEKFCQAAVAGGLFNSVATEPKLGSPSRGAFFATTAEERDGGYVINGHKTWTTGGQHLTHLLVSLMLNDEAVLILVEGDRSGLQWEETWGTGLSLRATDSHDVHFCDVWVPKENLISSRQKRDKGPNPWFPMILSSVYLGSALGARNALIRYALERIPTALGKPIATLPKIQRQIGEIDIALQAARSLLLEVAAEWDGSNYWRVAAAKQYAVEVANDVTDKALRVAGGASLTRNLPLERYFRDVRAGQMQPPSGDTALEIVGRGAIETVAPLPA